jgi:hypothetical protein
MAQAAIDGYPSCKMSFFLIQYDRPAGKMTLLQEFASREEAYAQRRVLESNKAANIEVVVLEANSLDDIKRTHRRYFLSLAELIESVH